MVVKKATTKKTVKKTATKATTKKKAVKKVSPKKTTVKEQEEDAEKENLYYEAVGRRKRSVARVRLFTRGDKGVIVNDKKLEEYFPVVEVQENVLAPLRKMKSMDKFRAVIKVKGGGTTGQAEASRHGISRALTIFNPDFRKRLRKAGYLTRDPREVERKKFGLKKARRAPQWKKR